MTSRTAASHRVLLLVAVVSAGCTGQIDGTFGGDGTGATGAGATGAGATGAGATGAGAAGAGTGTGGAGASMSGPGPVTFECNAAAPATVTPMRRLSLQQYKNTLATLFAGVTGLGVDPLQAANAGLLRFPPDGDPVLYAFSGMDDRLSSLHAQAQFDVAEQLALAATSADAKLTAIGTACALQARPAVACIDAFLDGFAMRAYRRPLTAEDRARYHLLNDGIRDGREVFRALVLSVLLAPQFVYQIELDGTALAGATTTFKLSGYELASRLSYHFWQTMPDAGLFAAAKDGSILTDAGYAAQAGRVFADPRTRKSVETFYGEWFGLGTITDFRPSVAFNNFVAGSPIQAPATALAFLKAASDEITALTNHFTWTSKGTFKDLLLTDLSFTNSAPLAQIYGVTPWDGVAAQPHLAAGERAGLLTRASFLISSTFSTFPIHRGNTVRQKILCNELPQPDPAALPPGSLDPPVWSADQTTRQLFEGKVLNEPCKTCHAAMNPIGYVLESYDAVGRFRTMERIFDPKTGAEVNMLPINSTAVPQIAADDPTEISNGFDLSQKIADSGQTEACFAREYFKFTFHRGGLTDDGCVLEGVRKALADGNLQDALAAVALTPGFQTRRTQ